MLRCRMAYMRGEYYIYNSGDQVEFLTPELAGCIPREKLEDLATMVFLRLVKEGHAQEVIERVYYEYAGNFGADGVAVYLGQPTTMERIKQEIENSEGGR